MHGFQKIQLYLQCHQERTQIKGWQSSRSLARRLSSRGRDRGKKTQEEDKFDQKMSHKGVFVSWELKEKSDSVRALSISSAWAEEVTGAAIDQTWPKEPPRSCQWLSTASVMVWSSSQKETNDGRLEILIAPFITWDSCRVSAAAHQQLLVADKSPSLDFNLVNKDSLRGGNIYHSSQLTSVGVLSEWFGPLANYCQRRASPHSLRPTFRLQICAVLSPKGHQRGAPSIFPWETKWRMVVSCTIVVSAGLEGRLWVPLLIHVHDYCSKSGQESCWDR